MNMASPQDMRKAIEAANAFKNAGILFVPMPVLSENDHASLAIEVIKRTYEIEKIYANEL